MLITTHRPNYQLRSNQPPTTFIFSPLSPEDSQELLLLYLGAHWQATGHSQERQALAYLATALGGIPVALAQIGLLAHKKGLSFERVVNQFKDAKLRNYLLTDTVFDQLKEKTVVDSVAKGWQQFLAYLNTRCPQITHEQHENHLKQFIGFLQQAMPKKMETNSESEKECHYQITHDAVQSYWQAVGLPLNADVDMTAEVMAWLHCLPLVYEGENQQWYWSLASLSALKLQSKEEAYPTWDIELLESTTPLEEADEKAFYLTHQTPVELLFSTEHKKTTIPDIPKMPKAIDLSFSLNESTLNQVEIAISTVGKPSEFKAWQLPTVNPYFIPRPQLTEKLKAKLPQKHAGEESVQLILAAATGMGGIGKTELARHFVTSPELSSNYKKRFWMNAASYSQLRNEFYDLASYLGLIEPKKYIEDKELIQCLHGWFSVNSGWLMIADNADEYNSIAEWLPKEGGSILVTTREPNPGTLQNEQIVRVSHLTEDEAVIWLYQLAQRDPNRATESEQKTARELVGNLGYLPLAIAQAAAYLREQSHVSIEDYQTNFVELLQDISLAEQEGQNKNSDAYSRKVIARTWVLSLQAIEKTAKIKQIASFVKPVLFLCTHVAPKNIPVLVLEVFLKHFYKIENFLSGYTTDECIGQLIRYSLLERNFEDNIVSVHQLVQEVIKAELKKEDKLVGSLKRSITALLMAYPSGDYKHPIDEIRLKKAFLPHLKITLKNHEENKIKEDSDLGYILHFLAESYSASRNEKEGKQFSKRALSAFKTCINDDKTIAMMLGNLGNIYGNLGKSKKQKDYLKKALAILRETDDEVQTSRLLTVLGNAYGDLGDQEKKIKVLEEALSIKKKLYDKEDLQVATTLTNLANAYGDSGNGQKQKELLDRALSIEEIYGENYPDIAITLTNLGIAYGNLGDTQNQIKTLERALLIKKKHYGETHYEVAITLVNLGLSHSDLGNVQKEKELIECALPIFENHYGKEHIQTIKVLGNLITTYSDFGKKKELLEYILPIEEKYYGKNHCSVAKTLTNLGSIHLVLGNTKEGKEILQRALLIFEKHNHVDAAKALVTLSESHGILENVQKRIQFLKRALSIFENHYGNQHFLGAITLDSLGNAFGDLGDLQKQEETLGRALSIKKKHYGKNHYQTAITFQNFALYHLEKGNFDKARRLLQKAICIFETFKRSEKKDAESLFSSSYIREGNYFLLQHENEIEKARLCYQKGYLLDLLKIETHRHFLNLSYKKNWLSACIEHSKIILKLTPKNPIIFHSLACFTHIKAKLEKVKENQDNYTVFLREAEEYFETSIRLGRNTGVYTEYAQFMLRNLFYYSIEKVISTLQTAIELKSIDEELIYGRIDRLTLDFYLQKLMSKYKEISFRAFLLAHYLLIQAYLVNNQQLKAKDTFHNLDNEIKKNFDFHNEQSATQERKIEKELLEILLTLSGKILFTPIGELRQKLLFDRYYNLDKKEKIKETTTIKLLNENCQLKFFTISDKNYQIIDAVSEINSSEDKQQAKIIQSSLHGYGRFFKMDSHQKCFVLEAINLKEGNISVGREIQSFLSEKKPNPVCFPEDKNNYGKLLTKDITNYVFKFFDLKSLKNVGCTSKNSYTIQKEIEKLILGVKSSSMDLTKK